MLRHTATRQRNSRTTPAGRKLRLLLLLPLVLIQAGAPAKEPANWELPGLRPGKTALSRARTLENQNPAEAVALYDSLARHWPRQAPALYLAAGQTAWRVDSLNLALNAWRRVAEHPQADSAQRSQALGALGVLMAQLAEPGKQHSSRNRNRLQQAREFLRKALELDPGKPLHRHNYELALIQTPPPPPAPQPQSQSPQSLQPNEFRGRKLWNPGVSLQKAEAAYNALQQRENLYWQALPKGDGRRRYQGRPKY